MKRLMQAKKQNLKKQFERAFMERMEQEVKKRLDKQQDEMWKDQQEVYSEKFRHVQCNCQGLDTGLTAALQKQCIKG